MGTSNSVLPATSISGSDNPDPLPSPAEIATEQDEVNEEQSTRQAPSKSPSPSRETSLAPLNTPKLEVTNIDRQATRPSSFMQKLHVRRSKSDQGLASASAPRFRSVGRGQSEPGLVSESGSEKAIAMLVEQVPKQELEDKAQKEASQRAQAPVSLRLSTPPSLVEKKDALSPAHSPSLFLPQMPPEPPKKRKGYQAPTPQWKRTVQSMKEEEVKENDRKIQSTEKVTEVIDLCSSDEETSKPVAKKACLEKGLISPPRRVDEYLTVDEQVMRGTLLGERPTSSSAGDLRMLRYDYQKRLLGQGTKARPSLSKPRPTPQRPSPGQGSKTAEIPKPRQTIMLPSPTFAVSKQVHNPEKKGKSTRTQAFASPTPRTLADEQVLLSSDQDSSNSSVSAQAANDVSLPRATQLVTSSTDRSASNRTPSLKQSPRMRSEIPATPSPVNEGNPALQSSLGPASASLSIPDVDNTGNYNPLLKRVQGLSPSSRPLLPFNSPSESTFQEFHESQHGQVAPPSTPTIPRRQDTSALKQTSNAEATQQTRPNTKLQSSQHVAKSQEILARENGSSQKQPQSRIQNVSDLQAPYTALNGSSSRESLSSESSPSADPQSLLTIPAEQEKSSTSAIPSKLQTSLMKEKPPASPEPRIPSTVKKTPSPEPSRKLKAPNLQLKKDLIASRRSPIQTVAKRSKPNIRKPKRKAKKPIVQARTLRGTKGIARNVYEDFHIGDTEHADAWRQARAKSVSSTEEKNLWREATVTKEDDRNEEKPFMLNWPICPKPLTSEKRLVVSALELTSSSSASTGMSVAERRPTFPDPPAGIVQIAMVQQFSVHQSALISHCPKLADYLQGDGLADVLKDIETAVFGLLVKWLNDQASRPRGPDLLVDGQGIPIYQYRLLQLWILAGRFGLPQLQNEAIDMLEQRIRFKEQKVETEYFGFVFENTVVGDALRRYITDICASSVLSDEIYNSFPSVLRQDICKARLEKGNGALLGEIHEYHIDEGSARPEWIEGKGKELDLSRDDSTWTLRT